MNTTPDIRLQYTARHAAERGLTVGSRALTASATRHDRREIKDAVTLMLRASIGLEVTDYRALVTAAGLNASPITATAWVALAAGGAIRPVRPNRWMSRWTH
jgi:hypothetical protein